MAKKNNENFDLWSDIDEKDFIDEDNIIDDDVADYVQKGMVIYSINVNLARHLVRVIDSLKPVYRRILYGMYRTGALPGHNMKSIKILAATMELHPHGDDPTYGAMVTLAQYWKQAIPLVQGKGNFGTIDSPDGYASQRYTEAMMSEYAYECFFEDFNAKAVTTTRNLLGIDEPDYLPSKFPNILVNGTTGVGNGFSACIPPYNCNDIVDTVIKLMEDPNADITMVPDFPTGCDIVDNDELHKISKDGSGKITMRGTIDIEETPSSWHLVITSIPFTSSYDSIKRKIYELDKTGVVKLDVSDGTVCVKRDGKLKMDMKLKVIIDKSLDPKYVRHLLYKKTDLEKTIAVQFTVIGDHHNILPADLRTTILAWLEERRIYKRSLYNHTMRKLIEQIDIDDIMIELLDKDNIVKTVNIIRHNTAAECERKLVEEYGMNSHQASRIANMKLNAFTSDVRDKLIKERKELGEKLEEVRKVATSTKKIDKIIKGELEDLRKYASPRQSNLIKVEGDSIISETEHFIVFVNDGTVRKLPNPPSKSHARAPYGSFGAGVLPLSVHKVSNTDYIFMMDATGKYTIMPVYDIPNSVYGSSGSPMWGVTKLDTCPVFVMSFNAPEFSDIYYQLTNLNASIVTLSSDGMIKQTDVKEYLTIKDNKPVLCKGVRGAKVKDTDGSSDSIVDAILNLPPDHDYIIYTKKGEYVTLPDIHIPTAGKNTIGVQMIRPVNGDSCVGIAYSEPSDKYVIIVTKKGYVKRIELEYLKPSSKRRDASYLATIAPDDEIFAIHTCVDNQILKVTTKSGVTEYNIDEDIPILGRKAKPVKLIPVPVGDAIIGISVRH